MVFKNFFFEVNSWSYERKTKIIIWLLVVIVVSSGIFLFSVLRHPPYKDLTDLFNKGEYQAVIHEAESYIKINPNNESVAILLARSYVEYGISQGNPLQYSQKALTLLDGVEQTNQIFKIKALILFKTKNYNIAESLLKKVLISNPRDFDAMIALADLYLEQDKTSLADDLFRSALRIQSGSTEASIGLIRVLVARGKNNDALEQALDLSQKNIDISNKANLYQIIATQYAFKKDFTNAKKYFEYSLDNDSNKIDALVGLADVLVKSSAPGVLRGRKIDDVFKQPTELISQALKINPQYIYALLVSYDMLIIKGDTQGIRILKDKINTILKEGRFSKSDLLFIQDRLAVTETSTVKVIPAKK